MTKKQWLKKHLLINLGFAPKLFGYSDDDLYRLTQGPLKKWTNGVEYYFGLTLKGVEKRVCDLPRKLVENKLIKIIHAPFVRENYPYHRWGRRKLYQLIRTCLLSRADPNSWQRLPKAVHLSCAARINKINIHAVDIILAPRSKELFKELNKLSKNKNIVICLENNIRTPKEQKKDASQWQAAHNPIKLLKYLCQNNLNNFYLTIDTAHLAGSGYNVENEWEKIKKVVGNNINNAIKHFHLVDYDPKSGFEAEVPGKGIIKTASFKTIIDDLYNLNYQGTFSLEVAPLHYHQQRYKLIYKAVKRYLFPFKHSLQQEEQYLIKIIKNLL